MRGEAEVLFPSAFHVSARNVTSVKEKREEKREIGKEGEEKKKKRGYKKRTIGISLGHHDVSFFELHIGNHRIENYEPGATPIRPIRPNARMVCVSFQNGAGFGERVATEPAL